MTNDEKGIQGESVEKEPQDKSGKEGSCGCGCMPPIETK